MDRFSSCYFCGDAVDAALEEYPIVPSEQYPSVETDRQIVLCPSCRRKLTTVIEHVLEAALSGEEASVEDSIASLDEETPLTDVSNGDDETTADETMTATSVEPIGNGADRPETAEPQTDDDGAEDSDRDTETEAAKSGRATEDGTAAKRDTNGETADTESESTDRPAGKSSGPDAPGGAYERSEYNRVVRLLQNRDFPVEIEEITVVAQSAYDIDRDTTHEILEALIDRGVVEDRGDRLVRS
ncbi:MAG: hypothetical protein ABEI57_02465 [Halapricum sp.]